MKRMWATLVVIAMLIMTGCGLETSQEKQYGREDEGRRGETDIMAAEADQNGQASAGEDKKEAAAAREEESEGRGGSGSENASGSNQAGTEEISTAASADIDSTAAAEELIDGMRPEFKEAMDSYEAFYEEYCELLKKYSENPTDRKLLAEYADMLTKVAEVTEEFQAWEEKEMNNEELKYYLDVNNRIAKKILEVSQ